MASADAVGCETQDGWLVPAVEDAPPVLGGAVTTLCPHTSPGMKENLDTDEEQEEPAEYVPNGSLAARLKCLPGTTSPAEYTRYAPPWCPNQQVPDLANNSSISQQSRDWSSMGPPSTPLLHGCDISHAAASDYRRKRSKSRPFTAESSNILREWFAEHIEHLYASEEEKDDLVQRTGMTHNQVTNWLISVRRSHWPGMKKHRMNEVEGKGVGDPLKRCRQAVEVEDGEIVLDLEGDGSADARMAHLEKLARSAVGIEMVDWGEEDWELVSLGGQGERDTAAAQGTMTAMLQAKSMRS